MKRETNEVRIDVEMDVEGSITTGDQVFDHLLTSLSFYMNRRLSIDAQGDLRHHLWEDMGITLGEEIREKIKDKDINRFGSSIVPMDDALVVVSVDISRPYLNFDLDITEQEDGFQKTLVREFLWALAKSLKATIHVKQLNGVNGHHVIEATFKGLGMALADAIAESDRLKSTKGVL